MIKPTASLLLLPTVLATITSCTRVTDISDYVLRYDESSRQSQVVADPLAADLAGYDSLTLRGVSWARPVADEAARMWDPDARCYLVAGVWLDETGGLANARDCPEWQFEYFSGDSRLLTVWVDWGGTATTKSWRTEGGSFERLPDYSDGQVEDWMRTAAAEFRRLVGWRNCDLQLFLWSLSGDRLGQLQFFADRDCARLLGYVTFDLDSGGILERRVE
ncbi:MAG: hypothetical protein A2Y64_04885 [Candidatus Coatesbacteria bacterium RBG_13_66_14]|uniref:Uncharacterized protein n=1 Tax=Candidatus Coatesbacteria bacterium RBG_13_66_14 TaxID=1817816 RepID=A0A1F5F3K5_9BACT|nr:MAG: hypothetical protein A2Y64_04885 [Candidatus Coatesbacteria bacterium RBG_13_66_14]